MSSTTVSYSTISVTSSTDISQDESDTMDEHVLIILYLFVFSAVLLFLTVCCAIAYFTSKSRIRYLETALIELRNEKNATSTGQKTVTFEDDIESSNSVPNRTVTEEFKHHDQDFEQGLELGLNIPDTKQVQVQVQPSEAGFINVSHTQTSSEQTHKIVESNEFEDHDIEDDVELAYDPNYNTNKVNLSRSISFPANTHSIGIPTINPTHTNFGKQIHHSVVASGRSMSTRTPGLVTTIDRFNRETQGTH